MPEENDKNIRIPVIGEEGKHTNHKIRTIVIDAEKGIKALYCLEEKRMITYIFAKNKDWSINDISEWISKHQAKIVAYQEIEVDQLPEFQKLLGVTSDSVSSDVYFPNSESFILTEDIEKFTTGIIQEEDEPEEVRIVKFDKSKHIVYGVFLVPEKADHDGDVISADDIEKVAHGFLIEYRDIDEMHKKETTDADIIESAIAWDEGLNYYGKKLTKGTWFGAIKIRDEEVWQKVLTGKYKAFSVRIAGKRENIGGE